MHKGLSQNPLGVHSQAPLPIFSGKLIIPQSLALNFVTPSIRGANPQLSVIFDFFRLRFPMILPPMILPIPDPQSFH